MKNKFLAAIIQTNTANNIKQGFDELQSLVRAAAHEGAKLIVTPEGSNLLERDKEKFAHACPLENDPETLKQYSDLARELKIVLVIGSALFRRENDRAANRSLVFNEDGALIAQYDKIHLFDVNIGVGQESKESNTYRPGEEAVIAQTSLANIGLSICYDVRFSYLYRKLAQNGAHILTIPAAFTVPTGRAHWEVLLRARAIETSSYVIAAAQVGTHMDGRKTYGNSMIIAPWGEILVQLNDKDTGFAIAEIDLEKVKDVRSKIPAWGINQEFVGP